VHAGFQGGGWYDGQRMRSGLIAYLALLVVLAYAGRIALRQYPLGAREAASIYGCLALLFALYLAPGFGATREWLRARLHGPRRAAICVAVFLAPYLLYCAGTDDFRGPAFAKLAGLAALVFGLYAVAPVRDPQRIAWQDGVALPALILPLLGGASAGIWNKPAPMDFMARTFLVAVTSWGFLIWRGIEGDGYRFSFSRAALRDAAVSFAGFALLAIPLGFALRFISWNPHWPGVQAFLFRYLTIFLFVAVLEELLFRGIIQNLLEGSLASRGPGSRRLAQAAASVLFGFSHMLHAPAPNWRYVALATLAGWFYGSAYRRHRSLMASSAVHALVDTLWRTFFLLH
jgi:uncharacterized protein